MKLPTLPRYIIGAIIMIVVVRLCIISAAAKTATGVKEEFEVESLVGVEQTKRSTKATVVECHVDINDWKQTKLKDNKVKELRFANRICI